MSSYNKPKYLKIQEGFESAKMEVQTLSAERHEVMDKRRAALKTLEKAKAGTNPATPGWINNPAREVPTEQQVAEANDVLGRFDAISSRLKDAAAVAQTKGRLAEALTKFLVDKGVKDPEVLERMEPRYSVSSTSNGA